MNNLIEYKTGQIGQKSPIEKTISGLWDIHDFPYYGKKYIDTRKKFGFNFANLPPNFIETENY